MSIALLAAAAVIIICVLINRISNKIGVPYLSPLSDLECYSVLTVF